MTFVPLTIKGDTAVIHLTRGLSAMIDVEDWERVFAAGKWHAHRGGPNLNVFYARMKSGRRRVFLHNFLCPTADRTYPDHVNRDRLDNRKSNLRAATRSQNMANRARRNRTGFRGVRAQRKGGGFQALIKFGPKSIALGTYRTAEEAARAYDAKAIEVFGEFAILNFPKKGEAA